MNVYFISILMSAFWPNVMYVEKRIFYQQHTPQGNFTIFPTEVATLSTETGSGGCRPPTKTQAQPPLAPDLYFVTGPCKNFLMGII